MSKPENAGIKRLQPPLLAENVYTEKTHNIYRGGTPDLFLENPLGEAWAEAKYIERKSATPGDVVSPEPAINKMSELQKNWAIRRINNNKKYFLLVFYGSYSYAMFTFMSVGNEQRLFPTGRSYIRSKKQIVQDIVNYLNS